MPLNGIKHQSTFIRDAILQLYIWVKWFEYILVDEVKIWMRSSEHSIYIPLCTLFNNFPDENNQLQR